MSYVCDVNEQIFKIGQLFFMSLSEFDEFNADLSYNIINRLKWNKMID